MNIREKIQEITGFYFKDENIEDVFIALSKTGRLDSKIIGLLLAYVLETLEKQEQK